MKNIFLINLLLLFSVAMVYGRMCEHRDKMSDIIAFSATDRSLCWYVSVPPDSFAKINVQNDFGDCSREYLKIILPESRKEYKYCDSSSAQKEITTFDSFEISYHLNSYSYNHRTYRIYYDIVSILCSKPSQSFQCSSNFCILKSKVCDGVEDCDDGKDEIGCERGVFAVPGVAEARREGLSWLVSKRTDSWGWGKNTHRAIVAQALASDKNVTDVKQLELEQQLVEKQLELKIAVSLLRNETDVLTSSQLAMFVNALLVTCHDPRHFYGFDIVNLTKRAIANTETLQPLAYIALCNANESLSNDVPQKLINVFNSEAEYAFLTDIKALSLMALSCMVNNSRYHLEDKNSTLFSQYTENVQKLKKLQNEDGSFGNAHTTALVTQALFSSGQEMATDWNMTSSVRYLIQYLQNSTNDFLDVYLSLPVFNGKSLSDIAKFDCKENLKYSSKNRSLVNIEEKLGKKISVQYSLYVGDLKDVVHTITLRVPMDISAYEVMQLAEANDPKYNFESRKVFGKIYVYQIGGISNDPENGLFWLSYLNGENSTELHHFTDSPEEIELQDGEQLIMWYKTSTL